VSAILSLLTFFLIAEKESKKVFPAFSPKSSKLFLLAVQKKVNMRFYFLSGRSERKCEGLPSVLLGAGLVEVMH